MTGPHADILAECFILEVFDRWGIKMFASVGTDNCWDGMNHSKSKPAVEGTYYYIAKFGETNIKGFVNIDALIRDLKLIE